MRRRSASRASTTAPSRRFDGHGRSDQFLRETMFGGEYGAFQSRGRHFFREDERLLPGARDSAAAAAAEARAAARTSVPARDLRRRRRASALPRLIGSRDPIDRAVVADSRRVRDRCCAINTDPDAARTAWVTIDAGLHQAGDRLRCLYSTDAGRDRPDRYWSKRVTARRCSLTVPPAGFVIYE